MEEVKFFSADSHVNEPPEAWERIPKQLREHGPHFVQDPPGKKGLYIVFDIDSFSWAVYQQLLNLA